MVKFDYHIRALSLPRVFGTDLASIPNNVPYLHAEPERIKRWSDRLPKTGVLNVGLVWAGNPTQARDRYRSISLEVLAPILDLHGIQFVSLQKGAAEAELRTLAPAMKVMNLGAELEDFADTAAAIDQLDLVISVCTSVAHIAGAMGKPVWVMLARPAAERWLEEREDSPWYTTMRLFRQTRRMQWVDVVLRVRAELQERLRKGAHDPVPIADKLASSMRAPALPQLSGPGDAPGRCPGLSLPVEVRGGILQYLPDEAVVGDAIGWYGEYLQQHLDLLLRLIRPGATVVEVGAGVGAHALALAAAVSEAGHLFLYEARPLLQRILRQNLAVNRVTNFTLMKRTLRRVGETKGTVGESRDAGGSAAIATATETLDELQLERLDWLKVNDGASALDVLEGGTETLWRLRPLLFLAVPDEQALTILANRVKEFSCRCWRMETPLFNPANFNRREKDIFAGRTALALLAVPEEIDVDITLDQCVEMT